MSTTSKPCKMCNDRGQTWSGSAPKCSFPNGVFSNEGWNCATANKLRDLMERGADELRADSWRTRIDDESCGVLWAESVGFIVATWYKDRGRTGQIYVMYDGQSPRPITLQEAETAIKECEAAR